MFLGKVSGWEKLLREDMEKNIQIFPAPPLPNDRRRFMYSSLMNWGLYMWKRWTGGPGTLLVSWWVVLFVYGCIRSIPTIIRYQGTRVER